MADFDPDDPLARFLAQFGITPGDDWREHPERLLERLQSMMRSFNTQMAGYGPADAESGMNWSFARDVARRSMAAARKGSGSGSERLAAVRDAASLAGMWLDGEVAFPGSGQLATCWTPEDWLDKTFPTWQQLLRPVVGSLVAALQELIGQDGDDEVARTLRPMVRASATAMQATTIGQSLGKLALSALSASDAGIPLSRQPQVALLPDNIDAFSDGLDADPGDVLLFVALREDARQRLFAQVGWLGPQLHALVQHYAREIRIDRDALERALEEQFQRPVDPSDAESAQLAMAASLFSPTRTPEQADILERLETLLALVEGWVDEVVAQVTAQRMPAAAGLIEMMRRRRASGGPAEQAWMTLVGMELRPRRARDAANLWAALRARDGGPARDAVWGHPDLMPKASDLDDPLGFADRSCQGESASELDEALAKILDEEGFGEDGR